MNAPLPHRPWHQPWHPLTANDQLIMSNLDTVEAERFALFRHHGIPSALALNWAFEVEDVPAELVQLVDDDQAIDHIVDIVMTGAPLAVQRIQAVSHA